MDFSKARFRRRRWLDRCAHGLFFLATLLGVLVLAVLFGIRWRDGWRHLDWQFLTQYASRRPERAGILAGLAGTVWVIGLTIPLVLIIGIATAIFLEEYQGQNRLARFIQLNINNLAGVPSIIYGILGLAIFVRFFQLGYVVLAATLTMTLLILPIVIVAAQEAIRSVPPSLRQASLALGSDQMANHLSGSVAGSVAGNFDRHDSRPVAGRRRDGAADHGRCGDVHPGGAPWYHGSVYCVADSNIQLGDVAECGVS